MLPQSRPSMRTAPSSGRSNRPATCSNVDLPAPDGPTRATLSPLPRRKEIPRSTSSLSPACLNVRTTPSSSSAGSLITERLDGIDLSRAPGRIERRQERQAEGHGDYAQDIGGVDLGGDAREKIELRREDIEVQIALEEVANGSDMRRELDADNEPRDRAGEANAGAGQHEDAQHHGAGRSHGAEDRDVAAFVLDEHDHAGN